MKATVRQRLYIITFIAALANPFLIGCADPKTYKLPNDLTAGRDELLAYAKKLPKEDRILFEQFVNERTDTFTKFALGVSIYSDAPPESPIVTAADAINYQKSLRENREKQRIDRFVENQLYSQEKKVSASLPDDSIIHLFLDPFSKGSFTATISNSSERKLLAIKGIFELENKFRERVALVRFRKEITLLPGQSLSVPVYKDDFELLQLDTALLRNLEGVTLTSTFHREKIVFANSAD